MTAGLWRLAVPILVGLVLAVLPPPAGLAPFAWHFLALFVAVVCVALVANGILSICGATLIAAINPGWSLPAVIGACALFGFAALGWNGVFIAAIARRAPAGTIGHATGGSLFVTYAGVIVTPPAFAMLHDRFAMSYGAVFGLLWGYPFLVVGEGLTPATAATLLTLQVVVGMCVGPLFGRLCGLWPLRRSVLVFAIVAGTVTMWTVVLLWPGDAPTWLLVLLVVTTGLGGPGSMIGFDLARTFNPPSRLGTATGMVNVGGFVELSIQTLRILVLRGNGYSTVRLVFGSKRTARSVCMPPV